MRQLKLAFLFCLLALFCVKAQSQEWTAFLSQAKINDLVDTGNELIMATDAGLVVMNKTTLEKSFFNKSNTNLPSNHIQSVTRTPSGSVWIGTYDLRIAEFDGSDFQNVSIPDGDINFNTIELYDIKIAPNGDFWVGSSQGVFHKQGSNWSQYDEDEMGPTFFAGWDIEIDASGAVYIGSHHIHKFENGIWSNITETTEFSGYLHAEMFISSNGDLYFGGDLERLGRYDGQNWQEYPYAPGFNGSEVIKIVEDSNGDIYYNTKDDGIYKIVNNSVVQQTDDQSSAFDNQTTYFHIDEQGRRWMNRNIHLSVNDNGNIQSTLISEYKLESNAISIFDKGEDGNLYFVSSPEEKISVLDQSGNWSFIAIPEPSSSFEFRHDILAIAEDDIWLATSNGLLQYNGMDWIFHDLEVCYGITIDNQGRIYARSSGIIYIIDNGIVSQYNTANSPIPDTFLSGHGVADNGDLWIAAEFENMILRVTSGGVWTTYSAMDYPAIDKPEGDFHFDSDGNVWVPHVVFGAMKFDGTDWSNPFQGNSSQITNTDVISIECDGDGKLFFAHQYGITTLSEGEWENLLIEDVPTGLSSKSRIEFDDNGQLWWASNRHGIFALTPETSTSVNPDLALLTELRLFPNPATSYTVLDFELESPSEVNVFMFNTLGQIIKSWNLGQFTAGSYERTIDLTGLPRGYHSIAIQVNDQISSRKIITH